MSSVSLHAPSYRKAKSFPFLTKFLDKRELALILQIFLRKRSPVPLPRNLTIHLKRRLSEFFLYYVDLRILKSPPVQGDGTIPTMQIVGTIFVRRPSSRSDIVVLLMMRDPRLRHAESGLFVHFLLGRARENGQTTWNLKW